MVTRAVGFLLLGRAWVLISGPVTLVLMASHFTPEVQGFYYTFSSVLALRAFFELALTFAIVSNVSHQWAHLSLSLGGRIEGNREALGRLIIIGRFVFTWYAVAGVAFAIVVGCIGWRFFSLPHASSVAWHGPWVAVVGICALQFLTIPAFAILEGCNQIARLSYYRLLQAVGTAVLIWIALIGGASLWVSVLSAALSLLADLSVIFLRYRRFFAHFLTRVTDVSFHWYTEIWPMQWRLGIQSLVAYFAFHFSSPVIFHYAGPVEAGRLGMGIALATALGTSAYAWMQANVPSFGMLIARGDFTELDRQARRLFFVSSAFIVTGAVVLFTVVMMLRYFRIPLAARLCDPLPFAILLGNVVLMHASQCQSAYLRAHRREPWLFSSVFASLLTGLLVWMWGRNIGATGAALGQFAVTVLFVIPVGTVLFFKKRMDWRRDLIASDISR